MRKNEEDIAEWDYFLSDIEDYILDLDRKEITKDSYKRILLRFSSYLRERKIIKPRSRDVLRYKKHLEKTVHAAMIAKVVVVLRGFFSYMALNGRYVNIMTGIRGVTIKPIMKRDSLGMDQMVGLLKLAKSLKGHSIEGCRNYAIIYLLATTGLRTIEVERSNIADISVIDDTNILFIQGKGRNDKDAYVKLSDEAYEAIVEYLSLRNDDNEALFVTHGHSSNGKRIQTRVIRGFIKDYFLRIGIENKNATAHSLRHFACSQILLNGGTLEEARQVLRHASISTTQIYNHALNRKDNNSEIRLSSKIKELMKED